MIEHQYPALPFDKGVADTFSKMAVESRNQGRPRPTIDLILATLNAGDFTGLPGVIVEDWS